MTANQINAAKVAEDTRHNLVSEELTRKQQKLDRQKLKVSKQSNAIEQSKVEESTRHNKAQEYANLLDIQNKDWVNRENVRLGFTNAGINSAHYQNVDENAKVANYIANDSNIIKATQELGIIGYRNDQLGFVSDAKYGMGQDPYNYGSQSGGTIFFGDQGMKYKQNQDILNLAKAGSAASDAIKTVWSLFNFS